MTEQQIQAKIEKLQSYISTLVKREIQIQKDIDCFDNTANSYDGQFESEFNTFLEEIHPEFNEECRSHFGRSYASVLKEVTNDYDLQYNEFVDNLPHERFENYNRLELIAESIQERILIQEERIEDLEIDLEDLE